MIAVEFDRPKIRAAYTKLLTIGLVVVLIAAVLGGLLWSHVAAIGWPKWAVQISAIFALL